MADPVRTVIDTAKIALGDNEFQDDTITFAGADTFVEGTILARDSVSDKLVVFVKGGVTNENGIPKAVVRQDITATGAGDLPIRTLVSGLVRKQKLVIDADGDDSNVDAVVKDQLRNYGIVPLEVTELNVEDNPQP